ncbi:hypothetical protein NDU88_003770 [Pleurodeles waltl]|uniref:Uncharacterized protein n=1 Tax=Pleurodeles waltl TaxID=8319 RepID=A0AAV7SGV9_PLEWA|nr:hypothetical protein NDU88_003770 [Pleurodeles waltl]
MSTTGGIPHRHDDITKQKKEERICATVRVETAREKPEEEEEDVADGETEEEQDTRETGMKRKTKSMATPKRV